MMRRLIIPLLAALVSTVGCIDRARVNVRCEWNPETSDPLRGREFEQHLDRDVELATDLAVRYADAVNQQRSGYEGHGGLIDGGGLRDQCMTTLLSAIAGTHMVPLDRVVAVRTRSRRPIVWDVMVLFVFGLLYAVVSWLITHAISRRFPPEEGLPTLVAPAIASLGISFGAVGLFEVWALTLEMVRLGNDHLSGYRASWNPWTAHLATLYISGILVFWVAAGFRYRSELRRFEKTGHAI